MADTQFWLHLLSQYGYGMVFAGTFLEGESVLMLAGTLAHEGYFSLPVIALCAFAGSFASDQFMFFLGRRYGNAFLQKRPRLRRASARVADMVRRHENLLILGFRFVCGIRNAAPLVLGAQGVSPFKFLVLNCLGAAVWAILFSSVGYACGGVLTLVLGRLHEGHHLWLGLFMLAACAASVLAWFRLWRRR